MKIQTFVRIAAVISLAAAMPALAQDDARRSDTRGALIGAHLSGTAIHMDDAESESGGGLGVVVGWGFSNKFAAFARVDAADIDYETFEGSYTFASIDLGARYSFGHSENAWRPYLELGLGAVWLTDEFEGDELTISGGAINVGGGMEFFINRSLALDLGLVFGPGEFNEAEVDGTQVDLGDIDMEEGFTSTRLNLGVNWRP